MYRLFYLLEKGPLARFGLYRRGWGLVRPSEPQAIDKVSNFN